MGNWWMLFHHAKNPPINGDVIKKHVGFERSEFHQQISKRQVWWDTTDRMRIAARSCTSFLWFQELFGQAISIVKPLTCWLTPQCSVDRWKLHCLLRIKNGNKGLTMDDFPSLGISASLDRGSVIAFSGNGLCCCGSQNKHQWSSPFITNISSPCWHS